MREYWALGAMRPWTAILDRGGLRTTPKLVTAWDPSLNVGTRYVRRSFSPDFLTNALYIRFKFEFFICNVVEPNVRVGAPRMNDDMDVSHVPVTMPPPTSEPTRSKTAALAVHLNASPALDLTQQQRETWFYSKDILNQMEQALARLDHFRQEDATTQAIATGTRVVPLAQQVYTAAQLPGTSLETPLPSIWLGKLLPTAQTETPDINEGACSSITDQPDTLEYEQDCDAARNAFLSGMLKPIDCRQEGQAGGTACQAAAPGMAVKHGAIADPPASSHKKGVRRNRKRAVFLVGTGDNAAAAANARLPDSSEKRRAVGDKSPAKFRGVTQHKNSGRFEAHVWINTLKRQVYLGGYASDALAAEAFDIIQVRVGTWANPSSNCSRDTALSSAPTSLLSRPP